MALELDEITYFDRLSFTLLPTHDRHNSIRTFFIFGASYNSTWRHYYLP